MAPGPADQKRKRGRPLGASRPVQNASSQSTPEDVDTHDADEQTRPKKRRRGAHANEITNPADSVEQEQLAQPRRRGRPLKRGNQDTEADRGKGPSSKKQNEVPAQGNIGERKPKAKDREGQKARTTTGENKNDDPKRSKGERGLSKPDDISDAPQPSKPSRVFRMKAKQGRDTTKDATTRIASTSQARADETQELKGASKAQDQGDENAKSEHSAPNSNTLGKRAGKTQSRSDLGQQAQPTKPMEGVDEKVSAKRRGRPKSKQAVSATDGEQASSSKATSSRRPAKARAKPASVGQTSRKSPQLQDSGAEDAEKARQKSARQQSRIRHLQETLRTIPRSTVESKWAPLDPPSISIIGSILADAQRSVLLNLQDTNRRRQHASAAILQASQRLHGKLLKGFPFPAPTASTTTRGGDASHEADFDFERTMDTKAKLENTLNPLLHSVSLLRKQLHKEEYELAGEYNHLHQLETNVKHEAKERKVKARKEHVLAPGKQRKVESNDENKVPMELVPATEHSLSGSLFKDLQDEELAALSQQIKSHMESLKGNLDQIGGVGLDINKSKAALQQVLLTHLDEKQYETVLLG